MEYTIQEETIMNKVFEQANEKCKNLESLKDINEIIKKIFCFRRNFNNSN